jgi:hypothetical protein
VLSLKAEGPLKSGMLSFLRTLQKAQHDETSSGVSASLQGRLVSNVPGIDTTLEGGTQSLVEVN